MLTKFIQTSYQKWLAENPNNLTIDDFINFAITEYKMNADDIKVVLEGRRGGTLSSTTATKFENIVETNVETSLKNFYQTWLKAPVAHSDSAFITACISEFKIDRNE